MTKWRSTEPFRFRSKGSFVKGNQSWAKKEAYELMSVRHGMYDRPWKPEYKKGFALSELDYQGADDTLYMFSPVFSNTPPSQTPDVIAAQRYDVRVDGQLHAIIDIARSSAYFYALLFSQDYQYKAARSRDGSTWDRVKVLATGPNQTSDTCPHGAVLAISNSIVFMAYGPATGSGSYGVRSLDGAASWSSPVSLGVTTSNYYSFAAVAQDALNWYIFQIAQTGEPPGDTKAYAVTTDGGSTWTAYINRKTQISDWKFDGSDSYILYGDYLAGNRFVGPNEVIKYFGSPDNTTSFGGFVKIGDIILISASRYDGTYFYPTIYRSTDNGGTFSRGFAFPHTLTSIVPFVNGAITYDATGDTVYVHFYHPTECVIPVVYESKDKGVSWTVEPSISFTDEAPFLVWNRLEFRAKRQNGRTFWTAGSWQLYVKG